MKNCSPVPYFMAAVMPQMEGSLMACHTRARPKAVEKESSLEMSGFPFSMSKLETPW